MKMNRPWLNKRRRLLRKARSQYKNRSMSWIGGILFFDDTMLPVPGIESAPKSGRPVLGLCALNHQHHTA